MLDLRWPLEFNAQSLIELEARIRSCGMAFRMQTISGTDPIGCVPIERPVGVCDFHATLLHAVGLDQDQLAWLHHCREELPTVLGGEVGPVLPAAIVANAPQSPFDPR